MTNRFRVCHAKNVRDKKDGNSSEKTRNVCAWMPSLGELHENKKYRTIPKQNRTLDLLDHLQNIYSLGTSPSCSLLILPTNSLLNPNPNLLEPYQDGCCCTHDPSPEDELSWNENVDETPESEPEDEEQDSMSENTSSDEA